MLGEPRSQTDQRSHRSTRMRCSRSWNQPRCWACRCHSWPQRIHLPLGLTSLTYNCHVRFRDFFLYSGDGIWWLRGEDLSLRVTLIHFIVLNNPTLCETWLTSLTYNCNVRIDDGDSCWYSGGGIGD